MAKKKSSKQRESSKSTFIQVRIPEQVKFEIMHDAEIQGYSLSEYIRLVLFSSTKKSSKIAEALQFWNDVRESEKEYEAGLGKETSIEELIQIAHKSRGE